MAEYVTPKYPPGYGPEELSMPPSQSPSEDFVDKIAEQVINVFPDIEVEWLKTQIQECISINGCIGVVEIVCDAIATKNVYPKNAPAKDETDSSVSLESDSESQKLMQCKQAKSPEQYVGKFIATGKSELKSKMNTAVKRKASQTGTYSAACLDSDSDCSLQKQRKVNVSLSTYSAIDLISSSDGNDVVSSPAKDQFSISSSVVSSTVLDHSSDLLDYDELVNTEITSNSQELNGRLPYSVRESGNKPLSVKNASKIYGISANEDDSDEENTFSLTSQPDVTVFESQSSAVLSNDETDSSVPDAMTQPQMDKQSGKRSSLHTVCEQEPSTSRDKGKSVVTLSRNNLQPKSSPSRSNQQEEALPCDGCKQIVSINKVVQCVDAHLACTKCMEHQAKQAVTGKNKSSVDCPVKDCTCCIPPVDLRQVLPAFIVDALEEKFEQDAINEIAKAEGILTCPGCGFMAELDPDIKVFTCPKEDCRKVTCRYCKKNFSAQNGEEHRNCKNTQPSTDPSTSLMIPEHWSTKDFSNCRQGYNKVPLDGDSEEYKKIAAKFLATVNHPIEAIYRVENPNLWKCYSLHRDLMLQENGEQGLNERQLFHGTRSSVIDLICEQNFDFRVTPANGSALGKGTYFAAHASTSYAYCRQDGFSNWPNISPNGGFIFPNTNRYNSSFGPQVLRYGTQALPFGYGSTSSGLFGGSSNGMNFSLPYATPPGSTVTPLPGTNTTTGFGTTASSGSGFGTAASPYPTPPGSTLTPMPGASIRNGNFIHSKATGIGSAVGNNATGVGSTSDTVASGTNNSVAPLDPSYVRKHAVTYLNGWPVPPQSTKEYGFGIPPGWPPYLGVPDPKYVPGPVTTKHHPHKMFFASVLCGQDGPGSSSLYRPPPIPGHPRGKLYDCVSDTSGMGPASVYVVFERWQCYPEYIIEFQSQPYPA